MPILNKMGPAKECQLNNLSTDGRAECAPVDADEMGVLCHRYKS
jgi:hypothetical protein